MHTLQKQCRPPSPRRRWRCDRSSYKRSLVSRIRDSLMHYLTGPEITETHPSPSRIHVGSNHSGMGKPIVFIESRAFLSPASPFYLPTSSHRITAGGKRRVAIPGVLVAGHPVQKGMDANLAGVSRPSLGILSPGDRMGKSGKQKERREGRSRTLRRSAGCMYLC